MTSQGTNEKSTAPRRYIYSDGDLEQFLASPSKSALLRLTAAMGKSCADMAFRYDSKQPLKGLSPAMACLHGALSRLRDWVDEIPAVNGDHVRFGNPAFREFHERLTKHSVSIVVAILNQHNKHEQQDTFDIHVLAEAEQAGRMAADEVVDLESLQEREVVEELICYLHDAFGHPIRLDFGTGHESSFQVFLYVLCKLHCFGSTIDTPPSVHRLKAVTLSIYTQYLYVTRRLQTEYVLEPAGSHGVWGLDDYHCLPFYFGAEQLSTTEYTPQSIQDDTVLRSEGATYMYFGCIRFIKTLKKGVPFFESSPMLNDISQLASWSKLASGLLKLYEGEVLSKRQVVQHFKFGRLFAANWEPSQAPKEAPTATFQTPRMIVSGTSAAMSPTKAPWAT